MLKPLSQKLTNIMAVGIIAGALLTALASTAQATFIDYDFSAPLSDGGFITGSFSGESGGDDILISSELSTLSMKYTNAASPYDGYNLDLDTTTAFFFEFHITTGSISSYMEFDAPPVGWYLYITTEPNAFSEFVYFDDNANFSTFGDAVTLTPRAKVPTPTTLLIRGPLKDDGAGNLVRFDFNGDGTADDADESNLIGIGLPHAQYYAYEIGIENTGANGDLDGNAYLDVLPAGFRLSGDAEAALEPDGCDDACDGVVVVEDVPGVCIVTISGPSAKKNKIIPRYVTIEPSGLAASAVCTTTVYVETTSEGKGKNAGTFEPKDCTVADIVGGDGMLTNTIALNEGVKTFDATTYDLLSGPVGSIQLAPQGCP